METESRRAFHILHLIVVSVLIIPSIHLDGVGQSADTGEGQLDTDAIYWPMTGRDPYNTNEGYSTDRGLGDPVLSWSETDNTTSPGGVASTMTGNVRFSGVENRIFRSIVDSNMTHTFVRDADTGEVVWSVDSRDIEGRTTNRLFTSPSLMDIDDDGRIEVLLSITDGNSHQFALFEPNITLSSSGYSYSPTSFFDDRVWISPSGIIGSVVSSSPMIVDITGDGVEDILVGAGNRLFAYYGNNGTLFWFREIGPIGETLSTPALYPGSGALKRIVINSLLPGKSVLRTTVVNFQGLHLKNITNDLIPNPLIYTHLGPVPMPSISDVNGDEVAEIIVPYPSTSAYGRVVIFSYSLEELHTIAGIPGTFEGSVALADLSGDGNDDILLQSRTFTLTSRNRMVCKVIDDQGGSWTDTDLWTENGTNTGTSSLYATPLACDLNEDSRPDAVFISNGVIYGILSGGGHYWNLSISEQISNGNGVIGDLNNDGFLDIYLGGRMFTQKVIDLKIKDPPGINIYLDDDQPVDGSPVTINCVLENTKGTLVEDVVVRFIDLDGPGGDPVVIGHDRIEMTDTAEASVIWTPEGSGDHDISVILDPENNITETDETNNQGENTFYILPAFSDLTITGIGFKRGDGTATTDSRRLVDGDPSSIIVTVANIGQKSVSGGTVRINVNEEAPTGGKEDTPFDQVTRGEYLNITVPWTPEGVPEGEGEALFKVEAWVFPPVGVEEVRDDNNNITVMTEVKSKDPVGSLYVQGIVNGTDGEPEFDVRVTLTIERTGESLGPVTTGSDGMYGFDMNFMEYLDGDHMTIRASKDLTWGENTSILYSEDIMADIPVQLSDIPTLSLFMTTEEDTDQEVIPGQKVMFSVTVQNDGNVAGDIQVTKAQGGNSTLATTEILLSPATFTLSAGDERNVDISFSVPDGEEPGRVIELEVTGSISGNGTVTRKIVFIFTVIADEQVIVQMISSGNVTLGPEDAGSASFEFYIYNRGNVPFDYQLTLPSSLEGSSVLRDGSGRLDPGNGISPYADVTLPNGSDSISGSISISTSGLGTVGSWDISMTRVFPDLETVSVIGSEPTDPVLGEEISLMASVRNAGEIEVGDILCRFLEGDTIIGSATIDANLEPGKETTVSGIKWNPSGTGEHTITFRIDPLSEISETMETNNEMERTFEFYPDLSVKSFQVVDESLQEGKSSSFKVTVENEGNAPLSKGFIVRMNLDSATGDQLVSMNFDEDLDPAYDAEETVTIELVLPGSGTRTIYVTVEPIGDDSEKDKSDNSYSKEVSIKGKDDSNTIADYAIYILILVILLIVSAVGFYIWKFGLPSGPPPEEDGMGPDGEEVKVESGGPEDQEDREIPEMDLASSVVEEPVLEMEIAPQDEVEEGPVVVAEVVVAEVEEEDETEEEEDDGLVPEV